MRYIQLCAALLLVSSCWQGDEDTITSPSTTPTPRPSYPKLLNTTPATLPNGLTGEPYTFSFSAVGGNGVYTWVLDYGTICCGLTFSPQGMIHGTPTSPGSSSFLRVEVYSGDGQGGYLTSRTHDFDVFSPLEIITNSTLPTGGVGQYYRWYDIDGVGGDSSGADVVWSHSGALPDGMRLTQTFGYPLDHYRLDTNSVSGPEVAGTWTFMVTLSQDGFEPVSKEFTLVINP